MRHPRHAELPLMVDRSAAAPLGEQLVRQVRDLVASGVLRPGDPLPSSRALAARLGVSRGTVTAAWDVLTGEGYLVADRGATRITPGLQLGEDSTPPAASTTPGGPARVPGPGSSGGPGRAAPRQVGEEPAGSIDLRPGRGPVTALDTPAWRGAWRDAAGATARGSTPGAALQEHLSDHLRLNRGIMRPPQEVLVTAGVRDGLQLVLRVLGLARRRPLRVAVENPGYPALRRVVEATGHTALPVPVDHHGLDPAALPTGRWGGVGRWDVTAPPDAIVLTPGHQYPLGGTMPVSRRAELLAWAREHSAVVIEDDYDSELRHTGQPLPALGALDTAQDTVVTLGSFAKVLGSSVGVGHLVAPRALLPELVNAREALGSPVSRVAQDAIARFMDAGEFQRHTARMRRSFRRRRSLVADALDGLPGVVVVPMAGGAHAVVEVPDEAAVVVRARERGVLVSGLGQYWAARPGHPGQDPAGARGGPGGADAETGAAASSERGGLVLGLTARDEDLARGTRVLREVLAALDGSDGGRRGRGSARVDR